MQRCGSAVRQQTALWKGSRLTDSAALWRHAGRLICPGTAVKERLELQPLSASVGAASDDVLGVTFWE